MDVMQFLNKNNLKIIFKNFIKVSILKFLFYNFVLVHKLNIIMHRIPKCIKNNQGYMMCHTQNCKINPTICKNDNCQCLINHDKCFNNIAVSTFFKHLNQLYKRVFDTGKLKTIIRDNLQELRNQMNEIIDVQIGNIDENLKKYESQESLQFKKLMQGNEAWTSGKIQYYLNLKQIKLKFTNRDFQLLGEKLERDVIDIKDNFKIWISNIMKDEQEMKYTVDYNPKFKGTDIQLKTLTKNSIQFQHKGNCDKHQDLILSTPLTKTTKLFIHATNLKIHNSKPQWFYAGIINKDNVDFDEGNHGSSISVSTFDQLQGNIKKIQGNGIQQKNECLYELEFNRQSNYLLIKIGYNKYMLDDLSNSEYYVIIGLYTANSTVRIYQ